MDLINTADFDISLRKRTVLFRLYIPVHRDQLSTKGTFRHRTHMEKHYFKSCKHIFIIGKLIINSTVAYITKK